MITPITLFHSIWIVAGIWFLGKMINMVRYQIKYKGEAGEAYLRGYLKEYLEDLKNE